MVPTVPYLGTYVGTGTEVLTYGTYGTYGTTVLAGTTRRERNLLALPTLDMYLPLSKFESIH